MNNFSKFFSRKLFIPLIIIIFIMSFMISSCQKEPGLEDYPNLLINLKLKKTDKANEVAVFLSTSHKVVNYKNKNQNNYRIIILNNTYKSSKISNIEIEDFKDIIESCKAIQINQNTNSKNPVITKLIFKVKNPKVKIVIKTIPRKISVSTVAKIASESESASSIIASKINNTSKMTNNYYLLEFFAIIVVIILIFWLFTKYESS